ncbi:MAG: metallophosphoesterase [Pseudomonadota bacterium]
MLKLFRQPKVQAVFDAPLAAEGRIYAIGDIHGRLDLLGEMVDKILQDAADFDGVPQVVFLGDLIDRGEDSQGVVEFVRSMQGWPEIETSAIMGNHEQMLVDFLIDPSAGARWLRHGGLQTLMSYGTPTHGSVHQPGTLAQTRDELLAAMGPHRDFIEKLPAQHRNGNILFAHAGANPSLSIKAQDEETLIWGHARFFEEMRSDGIWVVHGHTVVDDPMVDQGRISVDTGAYFSNRLTAVRLEGDQLRFFSVSTD